MYSYGPPHLAGQKQDDQLEHTFSSYVRIRDVALKTSQRRWTINRSGERGSGISVLAAWLDDDDGFSWGFGSCNIKPPSPNDPVGIDLTPTPIPAAKLRIFHTRQMTADMALYMGITFKFRQQPIRVCLLWWLLKLSFKIRRPLCSCFPCRDDVAICSIRYVVFSSSSPRNFVTTYNKKHCT